MTTIDQYEQEILVLKKNLGNNIWLLGKKLIELKENKAYLERYGTWTEFLEKGIDITERSAQRFMRIASELNKEMVAQWGYSKAELLLTLEEPERREIAKVHSPVDTIKEINETIRNLKFTYDHSEKDKQDELDYFGETEQLIRELLEKIKEVKDHYSGCKYKTGFNEYPRKKIIEDLWQQVKREV